MTQKSRSELQGLFKTGTKPSQQDFADFIESTLNIKDDGIEKPSGPDTPLKITAQGTDEKLIDFYAGETKTWSFDQKPDKDKIGLNISNSGGSKLFITSSTGNVGIGTTTPGAKLEVNGDLKVSGAITGEIDTANINSGILAVERIPNLSADKITSGILSVERIPNLSADKITSGILSVDRIPNLSTNKIASGILAVERIPNLSADKISSGILTVERIPNLSSDKISSGIFTVDRIPNLSSDKITSGILSVDRIPNLSSDKITSGILAVERIPNLSADKITSGTISGILSITGSLLVQINGQTTDTSLKLEHNGSNFIVRPFSAGGNSSVIENTGGGSLIVNPSGGNLGIGTTSPGAKLDVNGSLKATSLKLTTKLISFKKYSNLGDNINYKTDYPTSQWICSIAGFYSGPGDINEGAVADIIQVYTYPNSDGWWYIRADFLTHNKAENWTIWLMAINRDIAEAANSL
ncbi:hypothetical protein NSTC745_04728 [Nostoc sp. DSM 114161]|uniref:hypothetical protein n=1 Tax=Nostoc sp. DSM 114161 TaxID=3440143 RepID=UPI0040463606